MNVKLKTASGKGRVDVLNRLSYSLFKQEPQKAIKYAKQALDLSINIKYATGEGIANTYVSIALYDPNYRQLQKPVNIGIASGKTNDVGKYMVNLTPNYYRLRTRSWAGVREENFEKDFRIPDKQSSFDLTVAVIPKPKVRGRLVNSDGEPIRGFVTFGNRTTGTNEHGEFETDEPRGNLEDIHTCFAFDIENKLGRAFFWHKSDEPDELEIVLEPFAGIVGRLIDQNGVPVTSMIPRMSIVKPNGKIDFVKSWIQDTTVDQDGSFSIDRIPVGAEMAIKSALHPTMMVVNIGLLEEERIKPLEIGQLQPSEVLNVGEVFVKSKDVPRPEDGNIDWDATLSGLLTNESGEVIVGFDLQIYYGSREFHEVTDINGRYEFTGLPRDRKVKLIVLGRAKRPEGAGTKLYRESFEVICDDNPFDIQLPGK